MKSTNNGFLHKRLFVLALLPALLLAFSANGKVGPQPKSRSAVVVDGSEASVRYVKKANIAVPIVSITKLMTALVVLESGEPLDDPIRIAADDRDLKYGSGSRL